MQMVMAQAISDVPKIIGLLRCGFVHITERENALAANAFILAFDQATLSVFLVYEPNWHIQATDRLLAGFVIFSQGNDVRIAVTGKQEINSFWKRRHTKGQYKTLWGEYRI